MLVSAIAYCAHWFGIDRLSACVPGETLIADQAHWFGVDQLSVCVHGVTLKAHQGHWFALISYVLVSMEDIDS